MIAYSVYVIHKDGITLFSEVFHDIKEVPSDTLLSGFFTSIQSLANEIVKQPYPVEMIKIKGVAYHMKFFGSFYVVGAFDTAEDQQALLNTIGWQFLQLYEKQLQSFTGMITDFFAFKERLVKILESHAMIDTSGMFQPNKKLDTMTVFKLPNELKKVATTLLEMEEATLDELTKKIDDPVFDIEKSLSDLMKMGYLGINRKNNKSYYFC